MEGDDGEATRVRPFITDIFCTEDSLCRMRLRAVVGVDAGEDAERVTGEGELGGEVEAEAETVLVRGIEGECLREVGVLTWISIVGSEDRFTKNVLPPFLGVESSIELPDLVFLRVPGCGAT